ncbi:protein of unknown function [Candidatus Methylocalor cossyra]|uniref:Uncharacterized protein n=1 Tax=Candidatus Methylocalor cossyra TaxID=3108543 RepID=A0ABM9NKQ9_9GAMM
MFSSDFPLAFKNKSVPSRRLNLHFGPKYLAMKNYPLH